MRGTIAATEIWITPELLHLNMKIVWKLLVKVYQRYRGSSWQELPQTLLTPFIVSVYSQFSEAAADLVVFDGVPRYVDR